MLAKLAAQNYPANQTGGPGPAYQAEDDHKQKERLSRIDVQRQTGSDREEEVQPG